MDSVAQTWSALVDNSIYQRLNLVEKAFITKTVNWGGQEHSLQIHGYKRKQLRAGEDIWLRGEINALPTITRLSRDGSLRLCLYSEIRHESLSGSAGLVGTKGHLGNNLHFDEVPPAVERSFFQKMQLFEFIKKGTFIEFCRVLNTGRLHELEQQAPEYWAKFPELTKKSLEAVDRFQQICACLPEKHFPDAFHLWTAEVNRLDFFLVLDNKFINALTQSAKIKLPTMPVLPSTLLEKMSIQDRDPPPVEDEAFYQLFK